MATIENSTDVLQRFEKIFNVLLPCVSHEKECWQIDSFNWLFELSQTEGYTDLK